MSKKNLGRRLRTVTCGVRTCDSCLVGSLGLRSYMSREETTSVRSLSVYGRVLATPDTVSGRVTYLF